MPGASHAGRIAVMNANPSRQRSDTVLMVRPAGIGANPQTRDSNAFQQAPAAPAGDPALQRIALAEFEALVGALSDAGVEALVFEGDPALDAPDQHFPNNWLSLHADGTAVLYPMEAPNRRRERRADILDALGSRHGRVLERTLDFSGHEQDGRFLEGTGSLIFDHPSRRAFACRSSRTDTSLVNEVCTRLGYSAVLFDAVDGAGRAIYHTNVMLTLGSDFALVCLDAVPDPGERARLRAALEEGGRSIIEFDFAQLTLFVGNALELEARDATPLLALSATAHDALRADQRAVLERHVQLLPAAIPTIERLGGGSVRCMLAEVFLPRRESARHD